MANTPHLMHGPQFAKAYVNDYLKSDIPVRLVDYRNGWNVDDMTLPTPVDFFTYEPLALDTFPSIITVVISNNGMERIDFSGTDPLYDVSYSMRTYVWVKDVGSEEVTLMRDRLTTVIRSATLDYPCLQARDPRNTFQAKIDESTIREEYSDLTLLKGDRVLAGAYLSYTLSIHEIVTRKPIGQIEEIDVTYKMLGSN